MFPYNSCSWLLVNYTTKTARFVQTLLVVKCPLVYQIEFKGTIILLTKISSINNA